MKMSIIWIRELAGVLKHFHNLKNSQFAYLQRYYDPEVGRWFSPDPALQKRDTQWLIENGYYSVSPYAYVFNNPLKFVDSNGEEVYINDQGYIIEDAHILDPDDPSVYVDLGDKGLMFVGELGSTLYIQNVFENLLSSNIDVAKGIWNPFTFKNLVQTGGEWDLKHNENTIYHLFYLVEQ